MWRTEKDSIWNWETHPKFPNRRDKHVPLAATPIDISGHEATPKIRMATIDKRYLGADVRWAKYVPVSARWLDGVSYCTVLVSHISSLLILLLVWLCLPCLRIFFCVASMPHLWGQYLHLFESSSLHHCLSATRIAEACWDWSLLSSMCVRSNFKARQIFSWLKIMPPKRKIRAPDLDPLQFTTGKPQNTVPCQKLMHFHPKHLVSQRFGLPLQGRVKPSRKMEGLSSTKHSKTNMAETILWSRTSTLTAGSLDVKSVSHIFWSSHWCK